MMLKLEDKLNNRLISLLIFFPLLAGCHSTSGISRHNNKNASNYSPSVLDVQFQDDLIIPVSINNKTYSFLVDTGASTTVVDSNLANKITRPLKDNELADIYRLDYSSVDGVSGKIDKSKFSLFKPVNFWIGTEEIRDNDIWLGQDLSLVKQAFRKDISGIIGIDTIRKFNWIIDNKHQRLVISKDAPPASSYQKCTDYLSNHNGPPKFEFDFLGKPVYLKLDTGASRGYLDNSFIQYIKNLKNAPKNTFIIDAKDFTGVDATGYATWDVYVAKYIKFQNMSLGEEKFDTNNNGQLAVGMDFLSRLDRYALMPSRIMFCYDASNIERHGIKRQRVISVSYMNGHIVLFKNAEANLRGTNLHNGDVINKVNGVAYPPEKIHQIRHLISSTPKGKLDLEILRNNQKMVVHL